MSRKVLATLAVAAAFGIAGVAQAAKPHYEGLILSDSEDGESLKSFTPDTAAIFLHAELVDVPDGAKLSSTWIAEDTHGAAPANYAIDSVDLTAGSLVNVANFSISKPTAGWPVGSYRVDLFIDGKPAGDKHFVIAK